MVKGEDSIRRKKNKATRKKLSRKESVSARVAAIIATKKRRKSGKRRVSEGMCFGLPTPEDPFRERYRGKKDDEFDDEDMLSAKAKRYAKKLARKLEKDGDSEKKLTLHVQKSNSGTKLNEGVDMKSVREEGNMKQKGNGELANANDLHKKAKIRSVRPSKVLLLCLNVIQNTLQNDAVTDGEGDRPFFANAWGNEFLKYYASGNDVLVVGGSCPTAEQIAWMVSAAADSMQKLEVGGFSTPVPFLLYIVPSQARATEVRSVCKPLKDVGLHTVSVHPGVSVERQFHGLKSCEPEFIVSTPDRLMELVSLKAVDISNVSVMVVDKLQTESKESHLETIKSIRQCITGKPITIVCDDDDDDDDDSSSSSGLRSLLRESFCTLSLNGPVPIKNSPDSDIDKKCHPLRKEKHYKVKESCHCCH